MNTKEIVPENILEEKILSDPEWKEGADQGEPRPGHPEGKVYFHIVEVLDNIDKFFPNDSERSELRLIALIHDTFKHKVDYDQPKIGANHHASIAGEYAKKLEIENRLIQLIVLHDEAYNAWSKGERSGDWSAAELRLGNLFRELNKINGFDLYQKFYLADNSTGDKSMAPYEWFKDQVSKV